MADGSNDRRQTDPILVAINRLNDNLENKHVENIDRMDAMEADIKKVLAGFPGADPDGHRRAHEAMIHKAEERAKFWAELRIKLAEKGLWAVLCVVGAAVWWYLKERVKG